MLDGKIRSEGIPEFLHREGLADRINRQISERSAELSDGRTCVLSITDAVGSIELIDAKAQHVGDGRIEITGKCRIHGTLMTVSRPVAMLAYEIGVPNVPPKQPTPAEVGFHTNCRIPSES